MQSKEYQLPRRVLYIAMLMAFAMWAPLLIVPPMEHILIQRLSITHVQASLLYSSPILMLSIVGVPAGLIADKIGIKKAAGIGAIIIAVGTALRGTATDYASLLTFTIIYGIGLGWSFSNLPKLVSHCFPRARAHMAMGVVTVGIVVSGGLSLAITMPIVYSVTNSFQGVFFLWSIPSFIAAILWCLFVKEPPASLLKRQYVQILYRNRCLKTETCGWCLSSSSCIMCISIPGPDGYPRSFSAKGLHQTWQELLFR